MADMSLGPAPTRKTSEVDLNSWNVAMRSSPAYQQFLESIGQGHGKPTNLSHDQQKSLEQLLASSGVPVPNGMHVDQAGNLNQKSHLLRNIAIGAGLTAAAFATAGAAGFGPLAGLMSGGGAAAGGAGAASAATGGAGAAGGGAIPLLGGAGAHALAGLPAGLAGTTITAGQLAGGAGAAAAGGLGATAAKAGTSLGGKLLHSLLNPNTLEAAGAGLGGIADAQAHNRGVQLDAAMEGDRNKLLQDQQERQAQKDSLRQIQIASYLKNGGMPETAPPVLANGRTATKFDFGTRPASQAEQDMGGLLEKTLMDRMQNPVQLSDYTKQTQPSKTESTLNWLSPILSVGSALRGGSRYQPPANAPKY